MKWPFVWRKTADVETAVWKERAVQRLKRAEKAEKRAETEAAAKRTIATLYADLCDSHGLPMPVDLDRPERRQAIQAMAAFDEAQARKAAQRIGRLQRAVARGRAEASTLRRSAEHLQQRLDDTVGLTAKGIQDSVQWQPGYQEPTADKPTAEEATT